MELSKSCLEALCSQTRETRVFERRKRKPAVTYLGEIVTQEDTGDRIGWERGEEILLNPRTISKELGITTNVTNCRVHER